MKLRTSRLVASCVMLAPLLAHADDSSERVNVVKGDGHGYVAQVVAGDLLASVVIPATVLPTWSSNPWIYTIPLSGLPIALTGPIIHAAHGRWVPAAASFLGWTSVVATSWFAGAALSMAYGPHPIAPCGGSQPGATPCIDTADNHSTGIAIGIGIGVAGTILMTALDAWMARSIKHHAKAPVSFVANGFGGTF